jgi:molybdopterin converting factor small subunit
MATIVLPSALRLRHSDELPPEFETEAETVGAAFDALVSAHPPLREALFEEDGSLRSVVRVFVDEEALHAHGGWEAPLRRKSEIFLLIPIAGG